MEVMSSPQRLHGQAKGDNAQNVGDLFKLLRLYRLNLSFWEKVVTEDQNCSGAFPGSVSTCARAHVFEHVCM